MLVSCGWVGVGDGCSGFRCDARTLGFAFVWMYPEESVCAGCSVRRITWPLEMGAVPDSGRRRVASAKSPANPRCYADRVTEDSGSFI